jgi:pyruvyltransferase
MTTAWYFKKDHNFGDLLTPIILRHFDLVVKHIPESHNIRADVIGIGSILQAVPNTYPGRIWSSGFMKTPHRRTFTHPKLKIYAVRGKLTKAHILQGNFVPEFAFGDGGLLLADLCRPLSRPPKYKLGIIPHYVDYKTVVRNVNFTKRKDPNIVVINLKGKNIKRIIRQIASCQSILSSSLHGLVAADAFDIPNRQFRVSTSCKISRGDLFKYQDYYSAFNMNLPEPVRLLPKMTVEEAIRSANSTGPRPNIECVKTKLRVATRKMITSLQA